MRTGQEDFLLAIDNGTQSVRAMVFDSRGEEVAKSKVEIEPYVSPQPGWAEQDADYFWTSLCEACQQLWPMLDFPRSAIKAVALTTQRATVVNLDRDGKPLRPAIIWLDQRRLDELPSMGPLELLFRVLGKKDAIDNYRAEAEANWIAARQPEIWRRTDKFLMLSGYHTFRLTGRFVDAVASQVGYLPFDYRRQGWAIKRDWKWRAMPIRREMLPALIPAGELLGRITDQAAHDTGIPEGLPLIAAGSDKACEVLGSGCAAPNIGSLSYGTTATFNVTTDNYLEATPPYPAYPAVLPGSFNAETIVQRGYWLVSWFKREFGLRERRLAAERGTTPEKLFDDLLASVPPGSQGLILQPYWSAGVGAPGPEAKGAIIGFSDVHNRAHVYRAMIEGITYALREGKELLEKRTGVPVEGLRVSGGGSQSDQIMQITADIFGMTAERPHTYETSGLGAAIAAAVGVRLYADFPTAVAGMSRVGASFKPVEAHHRIYNSLYEGVYRKLYKQLQPSYCAIKEISGSHA
jgi:sugar (pentulose or hexulose) kinase